MKVVEAKENKPLLKLFSWTKTGKCSGRYLQRARVGDFRSGRVGFFEIDMMMSHYLMSVRRKERVRLVYWKGKKGML